jgi:hypothetical protein
LRHVGAIVCAAGHRRSSAVSLRTCQRSPLFNVIFMLCLCWLLHRDVFRRHAATVVYRLAFRQSHVLPGSGRVASPVRSIWTSHPECTAKQVKSRVARRLNSPCAIAFGSDTRYSPVTPDPYGSQGTSRVRSSRLDEIHERTPLATAEIRRRGFPLDRLVGVPAIANSLPLIPKCAR